MSALLEVRDLIAARELSAVEATRQALDAIAAAEELRAFVTVTADEALATAEKADRAAARDEWRGALHGVPFAVKDLQETAGTATGSGTLALRDTVPDSDAIIVARLRDAGAILVGKTNTPALGALGETRNRLGPDCRNPRDPSRTAGGSSGGSAAAVAAGLVPLATGTDSAGSIACPASFCGVAGMKPTRGRVPCWPAPDDSLLLNHTGPIAASAADIAATLPVIAGPDPRDPLSVGLPTFGPLAGDRSVRGLAGLRVAFSRDLGHFAADADVADAVALAAARFGALGAVVEEAHPDFEDPLEVYMPLYVTDLRRSLAQMAPAVVDELDPETQRELEDHPPMTAESYAGALNRLWQLQAAVQRFFERFDLLISPATGCVAFPLGTPPERIGGRDVPSGWKGFMPFQVPWNLTGHPSICVPCGASDGLPVGMLVAGRFGDDATVLSAACAYESSRAETGVAR